MEYEEEKVHTTTRKESNNIRQLEKPSYTNQNKKDKSAHRWRRISKKKNKPTTIHIANQNKTKGEH